MSRWVLSFYSYRLNTMQHPQQITFVMRNQSHMYIFSSFKVFARGVSMCLVDRDSFISHLSNGAGIATAGVIQRRSRGHSTPLILMIYPPDNLHRLLK